MTRAWFHLSLHGANSPSPWSTERVIDAQEILAEEVWSITTESLSEKRERTVYYVLYATCEVIGRPPDQRQGKADDAPQTDQALRVDWSTYIEARRLLQPSDQPTQHPPLLNFLKWTNSEEFDKGISRLWLKRMVSEGQSGDLKRKIAERYIIACVVGNRLVPLLTCLA